MVICCKSENWLFAVRANPCGSLAQPPASACTAARLYSPREGDEEKRRARKSEGKYAQRGEKEVRNTRKIRRGHLKPPSLREAHESHGGAVPRLSVLSEYERNLDHLGQ